DVVDRLARSRAAGHADRQRHKGQVERIGRTGVDHDRLDVLDWRHRRARAAASAAARDRYQHRHEGGDRAAATNAPNHPTSSEFTPWGTMPGRKALPANARMWPPACTTSCGSSIRTGPRRGRWAESAVEYRS